MSNEKIQDNLIQSIERQIVLTKEKLMKLKIRLNLIKRQRDIQPDKAQKRIAELFLDSEIKYR